MRYEKMSLCEAYKHTKECRELIHPNNGFFKQLCEYEKKLYDNKSTEDILIKQYKLRQIDVDQKVHNLKMGLGQALKVKKK